MSLAQRYQDLLNQTKGRQPRIVAVTKYASNRQLLEAYELGLRDFAENYVLAALERIEKTAQLMPEVRWHLSGHLQKNKVNKAVGKFHLIQSLDSLDLAQLISQRAETLAIKQAVLIQVKLFEDEAKSGYLPEQLLVDFSQLLKLTGLEIRGLMTMAPHLDLEIPSERRQVEEVFRKLAALKSQLEREHKLSLEQLSMGMSNDFALAIQEGSTMIRIGRGLFGEGAGQN